MIVLAAAGGNVITEKHEHDFTAALRDYSDTLTSNFSALVDAQPEDQLKSAVTTLLQRTGQILGQDVVCRTEVRIEGLGGRPDLGVAIDRLQHGNVELKAPGRGAAAHRFSGRDREQFERFRSLPNLVYTDGREWTLYRDGGIPTLTVNLSSDPTTEGGLAVTAADAKDLLALLSLFLDWEPSPPTSTKALAATLAPLTRLLRDEVLAELEDESGDLAALAQEWRRAFYPDADNAAFADAYAQTLTYALLLARVAGAPTPLRAVAAADHLDEGNGLLAQVLRVLAQPAARNAIGLPVDLLERVIGAVRSDLIEKSQVDDDWLYFYEDFLAAYDPRQRNRRGVYFTPVPIVRAQVRWTHELLRSRFERRRGMAASDVTVLDPATGTGTYPLEILDQVFSYESKGRGEGRAVEAATTLAANLYAFELLVGPYAVAHLRLTEAFQDRGADLPSTGVQVMLTDALQAPVGPEHVYVVPLFERPLAAEQVRASNVKANTPIVCTIGNPPYNRDDSGTTTGRRKGGIVRYDDDGGPGLIRDYLERMPERERASYALNLYNDYVYFWRWATWKTFEQNPGAGGIVSFITSAGFLSGRAFGGMRRHLREVADEIWVVDLGGGGGEDDENVFDIRIPVAITTLVRHPGNPELINDTPAIVRYQRIAGSRQQKYDQLGNMATLNPSDDDWSVVAGPWEASLRPEETGLGNWVPIDRLLPWVARGIQFSRSWPIAETPAVLEQRWSTLLRSPQDEKADLLRENRDCKIAKSYPSFLTGHRLAALGTLQADHQPDGGYRRFSYRSLDRQWCIADRRAIDFPRPALWRVFGDDQVYFSYLAQDGTRTGPGLVAHPYVPDLNATIGNSGGLVAPLWRDAEGTQPNMPSSLLQALGRTYGREISAVELAGYVYGVTGTPAYTALAGSSIQTRPPMIPITRDPELFIEASRLGRELIWWHTFGERCVPEGHLKGELPDGAAKNESPVGRALPADYSYDEDARVLRVGNGTFSPVTPEQWAYEISGMQVIKSWLGYRLAERAGRVDTRTDLDAIRPIEWACTDELLTLLAIVERTLALTPEAEQLLEAISSGALISPSDLPDPTSIEQAEPGRAASLALDLDV